MWMSRLAVTPKTTNRLLSSSERTMDNYIHLRSRSNSPRRTALYIPFFLLCLNFHGQAYALQSPSPTRERRDLFRAATAAFSSCGLVACSPASSSASAATTTNVATTSFQTYKVVTDASEALNPTLSSLESTSFLRTVAASKGGALWLGEHHNSEADHNLQVDILKNIAALRNNQALSVGLEQVQVKFQPALDDFIAGKISMSEMRQAIEWDKRWTWPFEVYEPIFALARDRHIPLIALNVNSEDLSLVQKDGLPGLQSRLPDYIRDARGFADFATTKQFRTYVNTVIQPSYDIHQKMGLLQYTSSGEKMAQEMSFRNFLSCRILWDEAMAANAYAWNQKNEGGLMVGLVGGDHVKFGNGVPGRFSRMNREGDSVSVLLNPTLIDSRPFGTVVSTEAAMSSENPNSITLQLRYLKEGVDESTRSLPESTGGVLALADYLVIG